MTVAQGINKITVIKKQSGMGSPESGSGGQILRRRTAIGQRTRDQFASDEIASHQQATGIRLGMHRAAMKLDGLVSASTYKLLIAAALRKDFAATAAYGPLTDVTAAATAPQFVTAGGNFLTAGLKVGDIVRWTGFAGGSATHNNSRNFLITALTSTNMSGVFLDASSVVADASGDSVTVTVVGKKSHAPTSSHTDDCFTIEEWYDDISRSELFEDMKVNQVQVNLPASGNAGVVFDLVGTKRTDGASQVLTTPTAETTTEILQAVNGALYVSGSAVVNITGINFTITDNAQLTGPVVGSNYAPDISRGRIQVTGQFTGYYEDGTISDYFTNETDVSLIAVLTADNTATADFVTFTFGKVKVVSDTPDDGEKGIIRTYSFTAEINGSGGTSLAWDQTIMTVQDSAA